VPKTSQTSTRSRSSKSTPSLGRPEHLPEDDRPFAEIRQTLHDALRLLSLHRWAFFVPFCVVTCAAFILSLYYPRTYRASTSFERRNDPVMMKLPMAAGAASFKYFRNTTSRSLTSPEVMTDVVENLGLTKDLDRRDDGTLTKRATRKRDAIARSLVGRVAVDTTSPSEQMDIIRITYTGPDPVIGKTLVDQIKRVYIRQTMKWIHEFLTSQLDYFSKEADEALAEVKAAQREETRLRLENPYLDPANPGSVPLKISQLEMERRELVMRKREYQAELAAQKQLLAALGPADPTARVDHDQADSPTSSPPPSAEAVRLAGEIHALDAEIDRLRKTRGMTDQHPEMKEHLAGRRRLSEQLEAEVASDPQPVANEPITVVAADRTTDTAIEVHPWQSDRARLLVQLASQNAKLKDIDISLDTNASAIAQLKEARKEIFQRQEEFAEALNRVAKAKQKHGQLEQTVASIEPAIKAVTQNRLLQFSEGLPARGSGIAVSPKASTILLLALIAGLASGVVFVVLAEIFDHVYRSSGQVARSLGLPMLEAIDEIVTAQDRRALFVQRTLVTPVVVIGFIALTGLTGSMAYLSIERPWTYEKLRKIPETALKLFADTPNTHADAADLEP
jgi:uncharacterized protein involved in exopolysaccharide biosynthesis